MTNPKIDRSELARTSPLVEPIHGRQAFESSEDFARFLQHLAEGPERTYKATAARLGIHPVTVAKLGAECRWQLRCAAWDREIEETLSKSLLARQIHARVEQADLGRKMRRLAEGGIDHLNHEAKVPTEMKDIAALATAGSKIERDALGVAEKHELEVTVRDPNTMSREEIEAEYEALALKAAAKLHELRGNHSETEGVQEG